MRPSRRAVLRSTLPLVGGAISGCTLGSDSSNVERRTPTVAVEKTWPAFGFDAANTGHNPDGTGPRSDVTVQWRYRTGTRSQSAPIVAGDARSTSLYVWGHKSGIHVVEVDSGEEWWSYSPGITNANVPNPVGGTPSTPTVSNGALFMGSANRGPWLFKLYPGAGEQWRFTTEAAGLSSPTVTDETVYFGTWNGETTVYALTRDDGTEMWSFPTEGWVEAAPAVADGIAYVGCRDRRLYALDADDGGLQWSFETDEQLSSAPAVVDGIITVGSFDHQVYAVGVDGDERWRFETDDVVTASPAIADGTVYAGSHDGRIYALDAVSGDERWRFETGGPITASAAVVDGVVYVGSRDRHLYAIDAATGDERWRFETAGPVVESPAVADGTAYVTSGDGNLYAVSDV